MKVWLIEPHRWKGVGRWITTVDKGNENFEWIASYSESVARCLAYDVEKHRELFAAKCIEGDAKLVVIQRWDETVGIRVVAGRGGASSAAFRILCEAATIAREEVRATFDDASREPAVGLEGEAGT